MSGKYTEGYNFRNHFSLMGNTDSEIAKSTSVRLDNVIGRCPTSYYIKCRLLTFKCDLYKFWKRNINTLSIKYLGRFIYKYD